MFSPMMDAYAHECVLIKANVSESESEGGLNNEYVETETFTCHLARDTSALARVAEAQGLKATYDVMIPQSVSAEVGDYFRDLTASATEGKDIYFHVTSNPNEDYTPATSTLDMKAFTAEKTEAPG